MNKNKQPSPQDVVRRAEEEAHEAVQKLAESLSPPVERPRSKVTPMTPEQRAARDRVLNEIFKPAVRPLHEVKLGRIEWPPRSGSKPPGGWTY